MFDRHYAHTEVFHDQQTPRRRGLEWLSRLKALDGLFRKLIIWAFMFCILGVAATNLMTAPTR